MSTKKHLKFMALTAGLVATAPGSYAEGALHGSRHKSKKPLTASQKKKRSKAKASRKARRKNR